MTARQLRKARRAAERSEHKSSLNQAEANRANAAHSTGPRTDQGKARSSQNSLQHGLYSKQILLPWEDRAEFEQLRDALVNEHLPATPTEELLVAEMTENFWRIRRFRYIEAQFLGAEHFDASLIAAVQRSLAAAERGFHKALAILRQLQKERGFVSQKPSEPQPESAPEVTLTAPNGFVPQNSSIEEGSFGFVSQNLPLETRSQSQTMPQAHLNAA